MTQSFEPGDDLIFQLESGYGLLRVLSRDVEGGSTIWHLLAYEELFPSVEAAEQALSEVALHVRSPHLALTDRAFERTPAAKLGHRDVTEAELEPYHVWLGSQDRRVYDRSALLMLGLR